MKKTEWAYLLAVFAAASAFSLLSLSRAVTFTRPRTDAPATSGVAGEAREVDMIKLRRLLKAGALSEQEAEYYQPHEGSH